jgi:hypothetical protein
MHQHHILFPAAALGDWTLKRGRSEVMKNSAKSIAGACSTVASLPTEARRYLLGDLRTVNP